ncbi:MAG TPA: MATE family efflux transporter [Vicinamibacterales bacterium]|nr:MATE family efflux transporter [Vicinamibacterales bacterium]
MPFRGLGVRSELAPMARLAAPVVLAELGWMFMGVVDTFMVGPLGPEAIGAVGVGSSVFMALAVFGIGSLLGLDTLVAQAFGAARLDECHRWLVHGVALALVLSVPLTAACFGAETLLEDWGLNPQVLPLTREYLLVVLWSSLPLLLYAAFRRYLQALTIVRPVMIALISANVVNALANYVLIFGKLGVPAMGISGAALATVISRIYMAVFLLITIIVVERKSKTGLFDTPLRLEIARGRRLLALGLPAAMQAVLEVGVFAAATALAGRLPPAAVAAHQIALNMAAVSFMVPFGIASAAAVRVGHAVGRRDPAGTARSGWTAVLMGVSFMAIAAATFVLLPRLLIGAFTQDAAVLGIGVTLLRVAAVFQLFDGLQGVTTGVLRGVGDTRAPMLWNFAGHWLFGLPLGYVLAFRRGWGAVGLWVGLSAGLIVVGVVLIVVWMRHVKELTHLARAAGADARRYHSA